MSTNCATSVACPTCGEPLAASITYQRAPQCPHCHSPYVGAATDRRARPVLKDVWANLNGERTWGQVAGWSILGATTFIPVMVLWGSRRFKVDEPLVPLFLAISMIGGAAGMALLYPKKGYWLSGVIAGLLFGPGVFLSFWLLAGAVMNKLIFLALTILGGAPSYGLYLLLLCMQTRQKERGAHKELDISL
jgi:hypothetical protein